MITEFPDFYESNLKLLKKNHPDTWKIIQDSDSLPVGEIVIADNGKPNLKVEMNENEFLFFHDTSNPEKDGDDFLGIVPENAKGTVIFQGMGLGFGPLAIIEKRTDIQFLIIFELSPGVFLQALRVIDLTNLLKDPKVILCLGAKPDVEEVLSFAIRSMRLEEISMLTHNPSCTLDKGGYDVLGKTIYSIANALNISSNTYKSYGSAFISNRLSFLSMIHHTSLIDSLKGRFKDMPAILVAAGPSLDNNIELMREFKEKAIIICVDSALPALLAHGVTPDFITSIDYKNITYEKIAACAPKSQNASLICSSWVGQKVAKVFPAQNIYWTFTGGAMENWINKGLGGELSTPGAGTVAHLSLISAIIMGCSPVIFTGQDLAFSDKDEAKDHAKDTVLKSEDQTAAIFQQKKELIWVDGNVGGKVPTSRSFINFIDQFEKMIAGSPGKYINASEGGAFIKGTEVMQLKDVLNQVCTKNLNISEKMQECNQDSKIGNIDGFLSNIRSVLKTTNDMDKLIKKSDNLSSFLYKKLIKLQESSKQYPSIEALPQNLKKKVVDIDKCHQKLDKKQWFWGLFDEATMNALQSTERMKYEIDKIQDIPEKYIEWLLGNLKRLEEVNRVRKELIKGFGDTLSKIITHHKNEKKLLKATDKKGEQSLRERVDLARLYVESDDIFLAKPVLSQILKNDPDNAEAAFNLGKIAALHTEYEKSDAYFNRAMESESAYNEKIDQFKTALGDEYMSYAALFWKFDKGSGKRMIIKGLRYCPDHSRLITELSAMLTLEMEEIDSFFETDNIEGIEQIIEQWETIFKDQPEVKEYLQPTSMGSFYKNCGKMFLVSKELLKAFENYHKAIACIKDNPEYYMLLSDLLFQMGKNDMAVTHYKKAVEIDKDFVEIYENKKKVQDATDFARNEDHCNELIKTGDQLLHDNQFEEAVNCYEKALLIEADNPYVIHNMGTAFKSMGQIDKAILYYEKTINIDPNHFNAYYNMGVALQEKGKVDQAISAYKKAIEQKPDFLNALNNLGNAYNASGRFQEAINTYKRILEIDSGYADALNNIGVAYQSMDMLEEAVSSYRQFLEIHPGHLQVETNLNNLLQSEQYQSRKIK